MAPGPAPLRRLTRFEIGRSLADVMGVDPALAGDLPPDEESNGYDNSSAAYSVSPLHAEKLLDLGEAAAAALIADGARLRALAGCDPTAEGDACVASFIRALGARLWRRPLDDDEAADLIALDAAAGADGDARAGADGGDRCDGAVTGLSLPRRTGRWWSPLRRRRCLPACWRRASPIW